MAKEYIANHTRDRVLAALTAGATYERAGLDHGVSAQTARRWALEAGLQRARAKGGRPLPEPRRQTVARMLRDGVVQLEIARALRISVNAVQRVKREMIGGSDAE